MAKIGVALSGGGHRATLYGLGVLLYLADVQKNTEVTSISSVSGGSLTNAYVGLRGDYRGLSQQDFRVVASSLAAQIANRGTLFAWIGTKIYLAVLVGAAVATFVIWWLPMGWLVRLVLFIVALVLWDVLLVRRRGDVCGRAYAATLFANGGPPALAAIARDDIDHVLCATHLNAGEHTYFSGSFVYAYRFGWGTPGDLPLHVAAQASTALPGAFPPRVLSPRRFGFAGGADALPSRLALVDGGVYDNMADQWLSGMGRRAVGALHAFQDVDEVILANASASMRMSPVTKLRLPILGELLALMRDTSIMYDNSASIRKSDLIDRFDAFASGPPADSFGEAGALLDIRSDPFAAAQFFEGQGARWPQRASRASAAMANKPADWSSDAEWAAGLKTNLSKFGVENSARLLRHAYALAAMNLHVFLGYPLVNIPPLADFEDLCRD